jgi:N-sulfoglucosamine sulfohydrolase
MIRGGKKLADIDRVPAYWPDEEVVRHDMLDYAFEVETTDLMLRRMVDELKKRGLYENTLIIVTSDHGMPFPRVKGYAYHDSNHIPLAVSWPNGIRSSGRVVEDFVDFTDLAPTILDVARINVEQCEMQPITGKSLRPLMESTKSGQILSERDHALVGKERTDVGRPGDGGFPIRGIVTREYLYLRNYEPARWPAGNPETGYLDTDGSPTKSLILEMGRQDRSNRFWEWNFGFRLEEELYDLRVDSDCVMNLANDPTYLETKQSLMARMEERLSEQLDPRMRGEGHVFDAYPVTNGAGFYDRWLRGEKPETSWVNASDVDVILPPK